MEQQSIKTGRKFALGPAKAVGIAVILLLVSAGVWTSVQLAPFLPGVFSRLSLALVSITQIFIPNEVLSVSLHPDIVSPGSETILSWDHSNPQSSGTFAFSYQCQPGVELSIVNSASGTTTVPCGTATDLDGEKRITLLASSQSTTTTLVPLSLAYHRSGTNATLFASTTLTVTGAAKTGAASGNAQTAQTNPSRTTQTTGNNSSGATTGTPTAGSGSSQTPPASAQPETLTAGPETTHVYNLGTTTPPSNPYGKPDLTASILAVGTLDKITNAFTATTTLHASDRIAVRFQVENIGTADSGMWSFNAVLPTYPSDIFQSDTQASLAPGDRIEYTIGFDQVQPGSNGRFVVNVDPANTISEANETNNIATTSIHIAP